jgi:ribosome-binding ATPase YchF (GTP1/OBG family)
MIGITGVATSGKDTLFNFLHKKFKEKGIKSKRYALADILKKKIKPFIEEEFNIDINNLSPKEKESIRPILVIYGKIKRERSNGRYWIDLLDENIDKNTSIPIVTDIRYAEYEKDELHWLIKENKGFLIHISRVLNGKIIPPANDEEARNDIFLSEKSHYKMVWCTNPCEETLYEEYNKNFEEIYEQYTRYRFNKSS